MCRHSSYHPNCRSLSLCCLVYLRRISTVSHSHAGIPTSDRSADASSAGVSPEAYDTEVVFGAAFRAAKQAEESLFSLSLAAMGRVLRLHQVNLQCGGVGSQVMLLRGEQEKELLTRAQWHQHCDWVAGCSTGGDLFLCRTAVTRLCMGLKCTFTQTWWTSRYASTRLLMCTQAHLWNAIERQDRVKALGACLKHDLQCFY